MENLADELQAMSEEPEGNDLEDFRRVADRLVETLRDQLADGQVEAIYSLQTAAAQVSRTAAQATEAGERVAVALRDLAERVTAEISTGGTAVVQALDASLAKRHATTTTALESAASTMTTRAGEAVAAADTMATLLSGFADRVTEQVSQGIRSLVTEATTQIGEQLAAEVDASSTELRGAALDHVQAVTSQLEVTSHSLSSLLEGTAARTEDARSGLEQVAQQGREQVEAAATALTKHREESEQSLRAAGQALTAQVTDAGRTLAEAGDAVVARVREAGSAAQEEVRQAARDAVEEIRLGVRAALEDAATARAELAQVLAEARRAAEEELTALRKQIAAAERREESVAERLQGHVEELVARTEASVTPSLAHLRGVADALLERDAQLEGRRVDEFARVLETLLKEGGASTRRLRDRIFKGMDAGRRDPMPAARIDTAPAPVVEQVDVVPDASWSRRAAEETGAETELVREQPHDTPPDTGADPQQTAATQAAAPPKPTAPKPTAPKPARKRAPAKKAAAATSAPPAAETGLVREQPHDSPPDTGADPQQTTTTQADAPPKPARKRAPSKKAPAPTGTTEPVQEDPA